MTSLSTSRFALAFALTLAMAACSKPASNAASEAQAPAAGAAVAAPELPGTTFASLAKLPDLTGPWSLDAAPDAAHSKDAVPFTPEYQAKLDAVRKAVSAGKPVPAVQSRCVPDGMPTMMYLTGAQYQFLLTPGRMTVISDTHDVRRIYTDGRKHPEDPDNTYGGDGIGHWEGDTLVADTVGLLAELPIVPGVTGGGMVHVVERFHLASPDSLQVDTVVTDSSLTGPYSYTRTYARHRGATMEENICLPEPELKL